MARKELRPAVAYLRTSSAANTGADKDSGKRQRAAIDAFARSAGFVILDTYYDEAVSGADPVTSRSGFAAMMERIALDGVRVIIVPTTNLIRQVLGAVSQFEKAMVVAKLKGARDRKRATGIKVEGRKNYAERDAELVSLAKRLHRYPINGRR